MKITVISDTHTKHRFCEQDLPGGDMILFTGDLMSSGYSLYEVREFLDWFSNLKYEHKVFIAGNHDRYFENSPEVIRELLLDYPGVTYLEDASCTIEGVNIYGSPWQPEFYNWAFNLPRNGEELKAKWAAIPEGTDILLTHGPAMGHLDTSGPPYNEPNLGCELLTDRINQIKPKIHVCGHIHGGYGYKFNGDTHFFNAAILNERYNYTNEPMTFEWNNNTNEIEF